jgi:nucleotide-binding universal stress UspA family protein
MAYKKILVPYDGSGPSDRALKSAIAIAKAAGSQIVLLNVVEEVLIPATMTDLGYSKITGEKYTPAMLRKELTQHLKQKATAMLDQKKRKHGSENVAIETKILIGYPPESIIEFAKEQHVDLVIMGTTGQRGILKVAVMGSVARKVAEESPCPIIMVH